VLERPEDVGHKGGFKKAFNDGAIGEVEERAEDLEEEAKVLSFPIVLALFEEGAKAAEVVLLLNKQGNNGVFALDVGRVAAEATEDVTQAGALDWRGGTS
jgi:hypothetical protein